MRPAQRATSALPSAIPPMYAATTAVAAHSELPTTRPSARTQTTSYARATTPEMKNSTVTNAAMPPPERPRDPPATPRRRRAGPAAGTARSRRDRPAGTSTPCRIPAPATPGAGLPSTRISHPGSGVSSQRKTPPAAPASIRQARASSPLAVARTSPHDRGVRPGSGIAHTTWASGHASGLPYTTIPPSRHSSGNPAIGCCDTMRSAPRAFSHHRPAGPRSASSSWAASRREASGANVRTARLPSPSAV